MTPRPRSFAQVDVFTSTPYSGNPLAVVLDADGVDEEAMARFARWTNLSETTFVLPASSPNADYRLRIFTPTGELPFAGHPTVGTAHAWTDAGNRPKAPGRIIQECGLGLVPIRLVADTVAFRAPPPLRTGPIEADYLARIITGLRIDPAQVVDHQWVDNGPGWAGLLLGSAGEVLALDPDDALMAELSIGVIGPHPHGSAEQFEVRCFGLPHGVREDPVTGSLNASLAQWLIRTGSAPVSYVASQGTVLGRQGRVTVDSRGGDIWVGGRSRTLILGQVTL